MAPPWHETQVEGLTRAVAVHFLLSPAAGFANGVVPPVDGGRAARGADPEEAH